MIDPISAFTAASAAFTLTKKLIGAGRELHDVTTTLSSWYEACADVTKAESQRKKPKLHEKMSQGSDSIEREGPQIITQRKALPEREEEVKILLKYR